MVSHLSAGSLSVGIWMAEYRALEQAVALEKNKQTHTQTPEQVEEVPTMQVLTPSGSFESAKKQQQNETRTLVTA